VGARGKATLRMKSSRKGATVLPGFDAQSVVFGELPLPGFDANSVFFGEIPLPGFDVNSVLLGEIPLPGFDADSMHLSELTVEIPKIPVLAREVKSGNP